MKTKNPQLDGREGRRRRAWELNEQGWKQQDIAAALGVTGGAVSQWLTRAREQGVEALRRHPAPGRPPRLTPEQRAQLPALVERGPEAYGCRGQVWTCPRAAAVLRRTVGGTSHPAPVSRLLHAVRHRVQRPVQRAAQRDAAALQAWGRARAGLGKKAPDEGRTSVWGDPSGCSVRPVAVRTGAPGGPTPLVRVPRTPDQRAASSGSTAAGHRFMPPPDQASRAPDVVRFLRRLRRPIRGQRRGSGAGAPRPRGQPVKDVLRQGAATRRHREQVPGYAPEGQPDEGSWNDLKRVERGKLGCHDLAELARALRRAKERLRHQRHVIQACIRQAGYHV